MEKHCKWCSTTKPITDFHKHKGMSDGRLNKCKVCVKENVDRWREANPDCRKREHAVNRERKGFMTREEYFAKRAEDAVGRKVVALRYAHKRRAMDLNRYNSDELTDFVLDEALQLAQDRKKWAGFDWEIDHIVPLNHRKASGLHSYTNIQVVPYDWNSKKSNTNFNEFKLAGY